MLSLFSSLLLATWSTHKASQAIHLEFGAPNSKHPLLESHPQPISAPIRDPPFYPGLNAT